MTEDARSDAGARRDGFWLPIIYILSALVVAAVFFLIYGPRPTGASLDVSALPLVNACINGSTACVLVLGLVFIKQRRIAAHRRTMLAGFAGSSAFLVSYVLYHWFKPGPRRYVGDFKSLYLIILLSHIVLAAVIVPLALVTLYRGWAAERDREQRAKHRAIAKITFPIWLYVSVTGVVIYLMLY